MQRRPLGLTAPYRIPKPVEDPIKVLEKAVKDLTKRVEQLEKQGKENK